MNKQVTRIRTTTIRELKYEYQREIDDNETKEKVLKESFGLDS